ncbi:MAG: peptidylprolyl isomerase [Actinomycetia bacterium]|jgi:cyclophilin family peptidyl-prolyl cis-trans isomerase|nr:peptidylprolyl isomerase [Actinomycetes bacterium]
MSKRSRDRQLAKLAARRQAERTAALRRRNLIVGILSGVVALFVVIVGLNVLLGDDTETAAPTPTQASPSGSPSPPVEPGTKTGTVTPTAANESGEVACGADEPAKAGTPKPQFAGPPPMDIDREATYTATMQTSCGAIVIELDPKRAPQTVNSFVFLAKEGYFDGQYFHRLDTSIDVIQGGDPSGNGNGGPGYAIPDELNGNESYTPGTLAMANAGPNTGGSQFFLITGPNGTNLDGNPNYTIFGKVIEGLDVGQRIQKLPIVDPDSGELSGQRPAEAVYIESVTIKRSGGG